MALFSFFRRGLAHPRRASAAHRPRLWPREHPGPAAARGAVTLEHRLAPSLLVRAPWLAGSAQFPSRDRCQAGHLRGSQISGSWESLFPAVMVSYSLAPETLSYNPD